METSILSLPHTSREFFKFEDPCTQYPFCLENSLGSGTLQAPAAAGFLPFVRNYNERVIIEQPDCKEKL